MQNIWRHPYTTQLERAREGVNEMTMNNHEGEGSWNYHVDRDGFHSVFYVISEKGHVNYQFEQLTNEFLEICEWWGGGFFCIDLVVSKGGNV